MTEWNKLAPVTNDVPIDPDAYTRHYISSGVWFIAGTEAMLIDDYRPWINSGLFCGRRRCENPGSENQPLDTIYDDEEICGFDEFTVVEVPE